MPARHRTPEERRRLAILGVHVRPPDLRGGGCHDCVWEGWEHEDVLRLWRELSAAGGGDLFADPRKLVALREVGRTRPREVFHPMTEAGWRAFHNAVVARIATLPPEPALTWSPTAVPVVRRRARRGRLC